MSSLLTAAESAEFVAVLQDLWDTVEETITVVKEPIKSPVDISLSGGFIPGFGASATPSNYTLIPESAQFYCLETTQKPETINGESSNKQIPSNIVYIKVQADAYSYINDGRPNQHIIFKNKTYSILGEEEPSEYLGKVFYIFKLQLTN